MASFSLDDIRAAADKKYGSTDIQVGDTTCRLLNALKLPKEKRQKLSEIQDEFDKEDSDAGDVFASTIRLVAASPAEAEVLLNAVGDDLTVLAEIFDRYTNGTELGEASASAA